MMLLPDGRLVPMRCGASNKCAYCAWLIAVENSLVVGLDAKWSQPTVGITLTTHRPDFNMRTFREAVAVLFRWLRRYLGSEVEYCGLMEWTTGKGGFGRMPHMHALVKGLDAGRCDELQPLISAKWLKLTGGAWVVECRPLRTPGGAIAYMVGHHHKREQAPPRSLRGMKRMRPSKGYFDPRPAEVQGRGESAVQYFRRQAKAAMREDVLSKVALGMLASVDPPAEVRDAVLEDLRLELELAPAPVPVALQADGRMRHLSTGEIFEGDARAIYEQATRRAA
jgi:hypothetical protein